MEDPIIMADRQLDDICKDAGIKLTDEVRTGFRLGFMAGRLEQMGKTISDISDQQQRSAA